MFMQRQTTLVFTAASAAIVLSLYSSIGSARTIDLASAPAPEFIAPTKRPVVPAGVWLLASGLAASLASTLRARTSWNSTVP
jgi:hypothetical protein